MILLTQRTSWLPLLATAVIVLLGQAASIRHDDVLTILVNAYPDSSENTLAGTHTAGIATTRTAAEGLTDNLWPQLRSGFSLPAGKQAAVQTQLDRFTSNPANIERILQRGETWLPHILNEIRQRGLPAELALLPAIESAFNPHARSPRNATGLWQFMPATARELGLQQNDWYDGRRDVIAATTAALDYLQQLQQRFDGDWLLALAAYNAGGARVQRAIRKNRDTGKPGDFWHLALPKETRDYVPKLLALRTLIASPEAYGLQLPTVPEAAYYTVVDTGGPLDFGVAAQLAGIPLAEIARLNPAYTRHTIHRDGPHTLVIPESAAAGFETQLAGLTEAQRVQWVRHRIRLGDTLSTIAQRYRITVARLREFNRLHNSRIIAGDLLIVPVARG